MINQDWPQPVSLLYLTGRDLGSLHSTLGGSDEGIFRTLDLDWREPAFGAVQPPQKSSNLRADRIQISYVPPKNSAHETVFQLLKERRVLEKFKGLLSALRLPRALRLKVEGCDGESNAWYEDDAVTVCYEYIDDILQNAPKETTPAGVTRADAIVGPTLEVFLHEVGHAVFDYLSVPVLGREEDAADQFAAYLLLQFAKSDARRLIDGVAYSYHIDASKPSTKKNPFADEHGLPAQRFYNVLCMAYGADSKLFADLVEKEYLPKERAEGCDERVRAGYSGDERSSSDPISIRRGPNRCEPSNG